MQPSTLQEGPSSTCPEFDVSLLPGISELPIKITALPTPLPYPETGIPLIWIAEIIVLMLPFLVLALWLWLQSRNTKSLTTKRRVNTLSVRRSPPRNPKQMQTLWIVCGLLTLLPIWHGFQTWRVSSLLKNAGINHGEQNYGLAGENLTQAQTGATWVPLSFAPRLGYRPALTRPSFDFCDK